MSNIYYYVVCAHSCVALNRPEPTYTECVTEEAAVALYHRIEAPASIYQGYAHDHDLDHYVMYHKAEA